MELSNNTAANNQFSNQQQMMNFLQQQQRQLRFSQQQMQQQMQQQRAFGFPNYNNNTSGNNNSGNNRGKNFQKYWYKVNNLCFAGTATNNEIPSDWEKEYEMVKKAYMKILGDDSGNKIFKVLNTEWYLCENTLQNGV